MTSTRRRLSGDCEQDCQIECAYPGQFSECTITVEQVAHIARTEGKAAARALLDNRGPA